MIPIPELKKIAADIFAQFQLAIKFDTSLFLLVHYDHREDQESLLYQLQELVVEGGASLGRILAEEQATETPTLYPDLTTSAQNERICVVTNLPFSSDLFELQSDCLEYLNLHRDLITQNKLRFVLFLPSYHALQFIHQCGDLWDFRHQTYWLENTQNPKHELLPRLELVGVRKKEDPEIIQSHIQKIEEQLDRTPKPNQKAALLLDLSIWLLQRDENTLTAKMSQQALDLCDTSDNELKANLELVNSLACLKTSRAHEAETRIQNAIRFFQERGEFQKDGVILAKLAELQLREKSYSTALLLAEKAAVAFHQRNDLPGLGFAKNLVACAESGEGNGNKAKSHLEESLTCFQKAEDYGGMILVRINQSLISQQTGEYEAALQSLKAAYEIQAKSQVIDHKVILYDSLTQFFKTVGDNARVERCQDQLIALKSQNVANQFNAWIQKANLFEKECLWSTLTRYILKDLFFGRTLNLVAPKGRGKSRLVDDLVRVTESMPEIAVVNVTLEQCLRPEDPIWEDLHRKFGIESVAESVKIDQIMKVAAKQYGMVLLIIRGFDLTPEEPRELSILLNQLNHLTSIKNCGLLLTSETPVSQQAFHWGATILLSVLSSKTVYLPPLSQEQIFAEIDRLRPDLHLTDAQKSQLALHTEQFPDSYDRMQFYLQYLPNDIKFLSNSLISTLKRIDAQYPTP